MSGWFVNQVVKIFGILTDFFYLLIVPFTERDRPNLPP